MDIEAVKNKIIEIVEENLGITLSENVSLKENGVDSLSLAHLIVSIEEEFDISFSDDDLQPEKLIDLSSLLDITRKYL